VTASGKLDRRDACRTVLHDRGDLLVIAGLGAPAWDVTAVGDGPCNLPLWGGMGGAAMMGLGLALAQPARKVLVITGDGEMLMGLGSLVTIAVQRPPNLSIVVQDNEHYGETGMQETATAHGADLVGIARAAGIPRTMLVTTPDEVHALRAAIHAGGGTLLAVAKVEATTLPMVLPPRDAVYLQARFREAVLGSVAHHQL
jgi:thiamine pyrophosphate-dependent acetolactate synthase large subunit-like protein